MAKLGQVVPIDDVPPGWEVEYGDFGGRLVRHLHGDVSATAYLYSNPDEVWAECTMCGQKLMLEHEQPPSTSRRSHRSF